MRNVLNKINVVGATSCFREGEYCKQTLDWLCEFCDKIIIMLDNFNKETEQIVLDYKKIYKNKVEVIYSTEIVIEKNNLIQGQIKKRWKQRQPYIREQVIKKLHELNKEKSVDIFIFLDSDELPINQFGEILEEFWYNRPERWLMAGFVEPFNNFKTIVHQTMSPHGRVWRYLPEMSALPYTTRTMNRPYCDERAWKIRNLILHFAHFDEGRRKLRQFFDNRDWVTECDRWVWQLPDDVRNMTVSEIADYQIGPHGISSKYPPISLEEYLKNNKLN